MLTEIRADFARPHAHAAERVGFVFARMGNADGAELQVLPLRYEPVADADYLRDDEVGAKIDGNAIRRAMQVSLTEQLGVLHVHMHLNLGKPRFSPVDVAEYPGLIRAFQNVSPTLAHGALLLSRDSLECAVWPPGSSRPALGGRIVVVGRPMLIQHGLGDLYA